MESLKHFIPDIDASSGAVVILSGGLDSTVATRLAVELYGKDKVHALSFEYGQKQAVELEMAATTCHNLGVKHSIVNLRVLGDIARGFSANIAGTSIKMPTIQDVVGDPRPATYVPNRNMIMLSIAASYAEVNGLDKVICGLQSRDEYSYHDCTPEFIQQLNNALGMNRKHTVEIIAPFNYLTKAQEIEILRTLDGDINLLYNTLTCYDPKIEYLGGNRRDHSNKVVVSCGVCPSCAERIKNFAVVGEIDPIQYAIDIPWEKLLVSSSRQL